VDLVNNSAQQPVCVAQHELPDIELVGPTGTGQPWHVPVSIVAQQSEVFEIASVACDGTIGEKAPTVTVSTTNNNRAGSFIDYSLSLVGTFPRPLSTFTST
jgi:hypothetical protein